MRTKTHILPLLSFPLSLACSQPAPIASPHVNDGGTDGGSDEFGAASDELGDTGDTGGELESNECLKAPTPGYFAYRHHCGGQLIFSFSGSVDGQPIGASFDFGFGPTYADPEYQDQDTYENPLVAACCGGPYDFQASPTSQSVYFEACKLDAVQQMCFSLPAWLNELAVDYPTKAKKLHEAAEMIGSADTQTDCLSALYEAGEWLEGEPVSGSWFNEITDTEWSVAVGESDMTIEINLLEILDIDYDEPPTECESMFENDDNLLPVLEEMGGQGSLSVLDLLAGETTLTDGAAVSMSSSLGEGFLSVAELRSGAIEMRNLTLRETGAVTMTVGSSSYTVDRWNVALVAPVRATTYGSVATFATGSVTFAASAVHDGDLYRLSGTNTAAFTLVETGTGWVVDGLQLQFGDTEMTWTFYNSTPLEFGL